MELVKEILKLLSDPYDIFIVSIVLLVSDTITGLIKAFYNHCYSSSTNRKGLLTKVSWLILLGIGLFMSYYLKTDMIMMFLGYSCIFAEFMSILENVGQCGIELNITKYFELFNQNKNK